MNETCNFTSEEIHQSVEEVKKKRPDYASMLDLYEKIFIAQETSKTSVHLKDFSIPDDVLSLKLKEKFPLINISQFIIDNEASKELFKKLSTILMEGISELSESIKKIISLIDDNKLNIDDMFTAFIQENESFFDTTEKEYDIDKKILSFIIFNSIKPSLALFSDKISSLS